MLHRVSERLDTNVTQDEHDVQIIRTAYINTYSDCVNRLYVSVRRKRCGFCLRACSI